MASPPILDFEQLLQPIPGEDPAGTSIPYAMRTQLEDARKEINPEDYDPKDPNRPEEAKKADWSTILRLCKEGLTKNSKDLQLAGRLTEALTRLKGFAGLRDGLQLMYQLVDQCWDRLQPPITEEGDLEIRAAPFNWLDDPDRGARFPNTVRAIPILPGGEYSLVNWRLAAEKKGPITADEFEKAVVATPREVCQNTAEDIQQSLETISHLTEKLNELMGQAGPGFTELRPALEESSNLLNQILQKKGPAPTDIGAADTGEEAAPEETEEGQAAPVARAKTLTREDLYRQLSEVAGKLQQIEPHSPIPYLIQKAVELGAMPFPMLMRALIRDENVITEMNRELGIHEEEAAG